MEFQIKYLALSTLCSHYILVRLPESFSGQPVCLLLFHGGGWVGEIASLIKISVNHTRLPGSQMYIVSTNNSVLEFIFVDYTSLTSQIHSIETRMKILSYAVPFVFFLSFWYFVWTFFSLCYFSICVWLHSHSTDPKHWQSLKQIVGQILRSFCITY